MAGGQVILVADDEESVRLLVGTLLERDAFTVLLAKDGQHALDVARQHNGEITALVTDYKMPRLDGLQLAKALVAERPGMRVIIMSGRISDPDAIQRCGYPLLSKPFTITGFMKTLQKCLENPAPGG